VIDTGQLFSTGGVPVRIGDLVRNTFAGKTTHVWEVTEVTSDTVLTVQALYGTPDDWDVSDTYEINRCIQDYANTDDLYAPIIDTEATTTSITNTLVKTPTSDFDTVCYARKGKTWLPFAQNSTVGDTGDTVTVVKTPDSIAI
jgi:hypothetical protein